MLTRTKAIISTVAVSVCVVGTLLFSSKVFAAGILVFLVPYTYYMWKYDKEWREFLERA
jgi:uncharacterized membrane protein